MSVQIFYFSGAGNSLHIAKELKKRLPDVQLIPMVGAMKGHAPETSADTVGFVFPIHCFSIPVAVRKFLEKIQIKGKPYLFAVTSRECSVKVFAEAGAILEKQGKTLDGCFTVQMPQTYLPTFEVDTPEEIVKKEAEKEKRLAFIETAIREKRKYIKAESKMLFMYIYYAIRPLIMFLYDKTKYFGLGKRFYADAHCSGCGTCVRICLSGKIEMRDNRPVWNRNTECMYCFACVHYCPERAVQIKRTKTTTRGRYHHPAVSAEEIMDQKY